MKQSYLFEYLNENEFKVKERTVRKYNMLAYKKLVFEYYPQLKNGDFTGTIVNKDNRENSISYELKIPTDEMFEKVHGEMRLHYTVFLNKGTVLLTNITPEDILNEGHRTELETYKGVMISKSNPKKDMFKVNLLNMLQK